MWGLGFRVFGFGCGLRFRVGNHDSIWGYDGTQDRVRLYPPFGYSISLGSSYIPSIPLLQGGGST